jgi:hypothetical protein
LLAAWDWERPVVTLAPLFVAAEDRQQQKEHVDTKDIRTAPLLAASIFLDIPRRRRWKS